MADLSWRDAIVKVLAAKSAPMHYTDIAEAIAQEGLRKALGATPASTVNAIIALTNQKEGENAPFVRVGRGLYALRPNEAVGLQPDSDVLEEEDDETGLINAFGMYWRRGLVLWTTTPKLLGQQQAGSIPVDFCGQRGVYLLYDGRAVVYVGRTTDQPLGVRLKQHTVDRLNGRWDRFSWFGVYGVGESGALDPSAAGTYNIDMLIATMEALLIEGLEPPQNRKRGDDFKAVEFLQVEDPGIQKQQKQQMIEDLIKKL